MSRKDYRRMAAVIAGEVAMAHHRSDRKVGEAELAVLLNVTRSLADVLKQDNPRFDRARFYDAAGFPNA